MVPRPDSLETFMLLFPAGLNAEAADNRKVILQFHFPGQVDGTCYFEVPSGRIEAREGTSATPDLTIETPFDVWMDIMTRSIVVPYPSYPYGKGSIMIDVLRTPEERF